MEGYSENLRVKVVEYKKKGHTIKETAETFGVSMKSVSIWKKWLMYEQKGRQRYT